MSQANQSHVNEAASEILDVLIVGAGLSGIGAARHLQMRCPFARWRIFESRDAIGGTWDLFRYPGIRSDSDMYTLGYAFKPWLDHKAIADGGTIENTSKKLRMKMASHSTFTMATKSLKLHGQASMHIGQLQRL